MSRLRPIDYFQVCTTGLLVVLGIAILVRAAMRGAPLGSYVIGLAFVAYGAYRAGFVVRAVRRKGEPR
jgi:hypothetical protein